MVYIECKYFFNLSLNNRVVVTPCTTLAATHTRARVCGWEGKGMKRQLSWLAVNKQTMCVSVVDDDYTTTARTTNKFD